MVGKFEAQTMNVPTINVSAIDFSVPLKKSVTQAVVNSELKTAAETRFSGILGSSEEPLATCDYN